MESFLSTERDCEAAVDMAFIVDSSGSISNRNWIRMKEFLKSVTNQFDIGPDTSHVAIVSYSTHPKVELRFNDLRGAQLTKENIELRIDEMRHQRGLTYIDRALMLTDNQVFTARGGMRPNVPKVKKYFSSNRKTCFS